MSVLPGSSQGMYESPLRLSSYLRPAGLLWLLQQGWRVNRIATAALVFHVVLIPFIILGMFLDPKIIMGAPAWNKPLKFALSGAIYLGTFLWLLTYVKGRRRLVQVAAAATGITLVGEQILINLQVLRGVPSHFNVSSAFDAAIYSAMGAMIFTLSAFNLVLAILLLIQGLPRPSIAWAIRFGVLASFAAMGVGNLMTAQVSPAQMAAIAEGVPAFVGAHAVGVEMGGAGLPFLGWSTVGGDLRAAHFVGLHGMQALPLLAWLLLLPGLRNRFSEGQRGRLMIVAGLAYLAWTALLTWQALRGQPVVSMDSQTLLAYGVLVGLVIISSVMIWLWGRGKNLQVVDTVNPA